VTVKWGVQKKNNTLHGDLQDENWWKDEKDFYANLNVTLSVISIVISFLISLGSVALFALWAILVKDCTVRISHKIYIHRSFFIWLILMSEDLFGKDLITTQDWSIEEIETLLETAEEMKKNRFKNRWSDHLDKKTFLMLFYNPSMRTRESFECAATELGGHAQYLEPKSMRLKRKGSIGEEPRDVAKVMSRYGCGIGIRLLEDAINYYGEGDKLLREYAKHAEVPVVSMAHDRYHPCQGLADLMGLENHLNNLKGKKLFLMWSSGHLVRSLSSIQADLLLLSRMGMDITLAYPKGWELDEEVIEKTKSNASSAGSHFEITHSMNGADGADVVYSRNWMSPLRYQSSKEEEIERALKHREWICDRRLIDRTNNAYFVHPMPIERGWEVTDEVADSEGSLIYEIAENRLHVQKALLAMTMGEK